MPCQPITMDTVIEHDTALQSTAFSNTPQDTHTDIVDWNIVEKDHMDSGHKDTSDNTEFNSTQDTEMWDTYNNYSTSQDPLCSQNITPDNHMDTRNQNNHFQTDTQDTSKDSMCNNTVENRSQDESGNHGNGFGGNDNNDDIDDKPISRSESRDSSSRERDSKGSNQSLLNSGNIDSLRHLIEIGAIDKLQQISANYNTANGTTLLHRLAATRCTNIIHALLSYGCAMVNVQDNLGQTPLHIAVGSGLVLTAETLLSFGADVNIEDEQGRTPLHYCLNIDQDPSGSDRALTTLLLPNVDLSISDFDGVNTLHCLSFWDLWSQLELALGFTHTARIKDNRGRTPLHYCFMNPLLIALDAAFVLLKSDASIMCKDFDGTTPMQRLMAHPLAPGNQEVARFVRDFVCHELKDPETGQNLLHISVVSGDITLVQFMGLCGVNLNEPNPMDQSSSLHGAVVRNQSEMVRTLLQSGADPNIPDPLLQTPLHLAAINARITSAKVLLAEGANPNLGDERGRTPLHCAVHAGSMDVVRLLLQSGCNVNALDKSDSLAIHYAAAENKLTMVEVLLLKGSKVIISDVEGRTPLHMAVATGNCDILRLLTLHGCSVNEYDKYGQTPLHMAAEIGNSDVVQTLMNRGANEKLRDAEGRKPEQVAIETGSIRVMHVMKEHRDSMIMYSQENLDDIDEQNDAERSAAQSRSNLPACVSNQTLDGIDECDDDALIDKPNNNGLSNALSRFESKEKRAWKCCVIL